MPAIDIITRGERLLLMASYCLQCADATEALKVIDVSMLAAMIRCRAIAAAGYYAGAPVTTPSLVTAYRFSCASSEVGLMPRM